jgi:hypothetical protein
MYKAKYEDLITQEEIEIDELPSDIIRQIKGCKKLIETHGESQPEDPNYIAITEKDQKVCDMINKWLDDVPEDDDEETGEIINDPVKKKVDTKVAEHVAEPIKKEEPKPAQTIQTDDTAVIERIKSKLKGARIHESELTEILGKKPNQPEHKLNGMRLRRVFLGNGMYQVV